ncbi:MAG: hypothetical protein AAB581_02120 [Patescibacteria group bacterium]
MKIPEFIRELGGALGLDILFKGLTRESARVVIEELKKKVTDEHRAELLVYIRGLIGYGPEGINASAALLRRQQMRKEQRERAYAPHAKYESWSEDEFVTLLSKLYLFLSDTVQERESRREVFLWLGNVGDQEFDAFIQTLHHEKILQLIKKYWHELKKAWEEFWKWAATQLRPVNDSMESYVNRSRERSGRVRKTYR